MSHLAQHHAGVKLPAVVDLGLWFDDYDVLTPGAIRNAEQARNWLERAAADTVAVDNSVQAAYEEGQEYFSAVFSTRFAEWLDLSYRTGALAGSCYDFCTAAGGLRDSFIRYAADAAYATVQAAVLVAA
jgi:hypothetical protein